MFSRRKQRELGARAMLHQHLIWTQRGHSFPAIFYPEVTNNTKLLIFGQQEKHLERQAGSEEPGGEGVGGCRTPRKGSGPRRPPGCWGPSNTCSLRGLLSPRPGQEPPWRTVCAGPKRTWYIQTARPGPPPPSGRLAGRGWRTAPSHLETGG